MTRLVAVSVVLACAPWVAAQAPEGEPAYLVRGRQTEARQRELQDRLSRFRDALAAALERAAPELRGRLEPPPPGVFGYQLLPRVTRDIPPPSRARPTVVSYSWRWSDTLIAREVATLEGLEAQLAQLPADADRARYQTLVAEYRQSVDRRRLIDADIDYNWLWQQQIFSNRPLFDRLTKRLDAFVERQTMDEVPAAVAPPSFVRVEHPSDTKWLIAVPVFTDIADAAFVDAFKSAIETLWQVRAGEIEYRVQLAITVFTPEQLYCAQRDPARAQRDRCTPPARGARIDLTAHAALFPKDGIVLTTGAASLRIVAGRALVFAPHDVTPRVLAHELGHLFGFPDAYLRGYRDLGTDGFQVLELVPDAGDLMSSPGTGSVLARHFEALVAGAMARSSARPKNR